MNTTWSINTTANTSGEFTNSTDSDDDEYPDNSTILFLVFIYVLTILLAFLISLFTLLFGVISWIRIPKWRSFKNYVYINIIFCYTMSSGLFYSVFFVEPFEIKVITVLVFYFVNASSCWLLIASVIIYMDIVVVFNRNVTRKIMKCNLFSWGVPLVLSILQILGEIWKVKVVVYLLKKRFLFAGLVLVINFCLYVRSLRSLLSSSSMSGPRSWQKVQVATFTFMLSGGPVLIATIVSLVVVNKYKLGFLIPAVLPSLQTGMISVCFLMFKSNRALWHTRNTN